MLLKIVTTFLRRFYQVALLVYCMSLTKVGDCAYIGKDCRAEQQTSAVSIRKGTQPLTTRVVVLSQHVCGGTLLRRDWVLTAAHCDDDYLYVVAGLSGGPIAEVTSKVKYFYVHYEYIRPPENDIAVLYLETPIEENKFISYARLPNQNMPVSCSNAIAMGWGKLWSGETVAYSNSMQCFEISTLDTGKCHKFMSWFDFDKLMCSLTSDKSKTCLDDFGGPVICDGTLIGIVVWQIECGEPFTPGIYARTDMYMGFIDTVVNGAPRPTCCGGLLVSCVVLYFLRIFE